MDKALLLARPILLPLAEKWAKEQEILILKSGSPLPEENLADARAAGVNFPEKIRLLAVDEIPLPDNPILRQASHSMNLITKDTPASPFVTASLSQRIAGTIES